MKKRFLVLTLVLGMMVVPAVAAEDGEINIPRVSRVQDSKTHLWGLEDPEDFHVILPAEYDAISDFSEDGYAVVRKDRVPEGEQWYMEYGLIDWKGNFVLPLGEYNYIEMGTDGIALVRNKEEMSAYLRASDRTPVTDFCFRDAAKFYQIGVCTMLVGGEERYGAVNAQGETVIPFEYDQLDSPWPSSYYKLISASKDGHSGAFNYDGSLLRRCIYPTGTAMYRSLSLPAQMTEEEEISALITASQTWEPIQDSEGLWGYHIPQGNAAEDPGWAIPPRYAAAQPFDENGRAKVTDKDGRSGFIDQSGDFYLSGGEALTFTDVPAGSWYEKGVKTCAEQGVMVGTGEGKFSPDTDLNVAECLTLALRLYDMQRGGEGTLEKAPEDWGKLKLTLNDGTVFEGYGEVYKPFAWSEGDGLYISCEDHGPTLWDQEVWGTARSGSATVTIGDQTIPGTMRLDMGVSDFLLTFVPENAGDNELIKSTYQEDAPSPQKWYRDAAYTAKAWGLLDEQGSGFSQLLSWSRSNLDVRAERRAFALALSDAAGNLEKKYTVETIYDVYNAETSPLAREENEGIYALYEAGILNGINEFGVLGGHEYLTRAQAAVMVARVLDPEQRLTEPPAIPNGYDRAVMELRGGFTYNPQSETTYETDDCTVFVYDRGGAMHTGTGYITIIYKPDSAKGDGFTFGPPTPGGNSSPLIPRTPDHVELSEDKKTFTYSYHFDEPLISGGRMIRAAGDFVYTVDLPTGAVTENIPQVSEDANTYASVLERTLAGYAERNYVVEKTIEAPLCSLIFHYFPAEDGTRSYFLDLIYKTDVDVDVSGNIWHTDEGAVKAIGLPTTGDDGTGQAGYPVYYTGHMPDSMSLSEDGNTFTLTYNESRYGSPYTQTIDLRSGLSEGLAGELSVTHTAE